MISEYLIKYWNLNKEGLIFAGILFLIVFYFYFWRGNKYERR